MIFGGFLDTDLTNQCYLIDHNRQSIQKMKKSKPRGRNRALAVQRDNHADFQIQPQAQPSSAN